VGEEKTMSEFKAITTQEEFDSMVKERLDRQAKKTAEETEKRFKDWLSPDDVKAKTEELEKQLADKEAKLGESKAAYDKLSAEKKALELDRAREAAARDAGLPFELAGRLSGTTPDELKADAEALSKLVSAKQCEPYVQPLFSAGQPQPAAGSTDAAYLSMLGDLSE
jgi:hypothetical protein